MFKLLLKHSRIQIGAVLIMLSLLSGLFCPLPIGTTAVAESSPVYSVQFEMNGGTLVSGRLLQHIPEGEAAIAPELEREGYIQIGWNEDFDSVTEDLIVVALWKQIKVGSSVIASKNDEIASLSAEEVYAKISPSVVEIIVFNNKGVELGLGSGFFIDDEGTVATNYHVIEGAASAIVVTSLGLEYDVISVQAYDVDKDLAVLRTGASEYPPLQVSQDDVLPGQTVYALGSSEGLTGTFSTGVISSAIREYEGVQYIQTTAPISHGNSGGPLVNTAGEVIGINTMTLTTGQNLNFSIRIEELLNLDYSSEIALDEVTNAGLSSFISAKEDFGVVGNIVYFGSYEQDNDLNNGGEPVAWDVLDVHNGKCLLISHNVLDGAPFNEHNNSYQWSVSTLRNWLNNDFLNFAFSPKEIEAIQLTQVDNSASQNYGYFGGDKSTEDKLFLLSYSELVNYYDYPDHVCLATDYAIERINGTSATEGVNYRPWWLRSAGGSWNEAVYARTYTRPTTGHYSFIIDWCDTSEVLGVRPAMWLNIDSL